MVTVCRILARVLVHLEETGYTDTQKQRQATVREHADLPARASDASTAQGAD